MKIKNYQIATSNIKRQKLSHPIFEDEDEYALIENQLEKQRRLKEAKTSSKPEDFVQKLLS